MASDPRRYSIFLKPAAEAALAALAKKDRRLVGRRIDSLALDPRPKGAEKLKGFADLYRVRAGNNRVIYQIEDRILRILVVTIGDRKDVYRGL